MGDRAAMLGGSKVLEHPGFALVVLSGLERGREEIIDGERFRIGKSKHNDLVLGDETVSRAHCEIVRDRRGYLLRDLGSTNGTLLDGAEIKEAWLKPGAVITVGKVELKVRPWAERIEVAPSEQTRYGDLVGRSLAMRQLFAWLERIAKTDSPVLIRGEVGAGKKLCARTVHGASSRANGPFVVFDCAAPAALLSGELFGDERGGVRPGALESAQRGTLVLEEVGELPLDLQPLLLRAVEQRAFRRLGGVQAAQMDARIVATSSRDLRAEAERGKFREDLLFRLGGTAVDVPALRDRREDIPLLVEAWLPGEGRLAAGVLEALALHDWPGNASELRKVVHSAAQREATVPFPTAGSPAFAPGASYRETKAGWEAAFERAYVAWLLDRNAGNISAAARAADMDRKYLHKLARRHGLHPKAR